MKKHLLSLFAVFITGFISLSFASPSIPVEIDQDIYPGDTISIPIDELAKGVPYNLACTVIDMNNVNNKVIVRVGVDTPSAHSAFDVDLNGTLIQSAYPDKILQLNKVRNEVIVKGIINYGNSNCYGEGCPYINIEVTNADSDDNIRISNCVATPDLSYYEQF